MSGTQNSRTRFQSPGGSGSSFAGSDIEENGVLKASGISTFNFTGAATVTPGAPGEADINVPGGSSSLAPEEHVVTALELAAKQFTLSTPPTVYWADVCNGTPLADTIDYQVAGNIFSWNGLGLDGIIAEGDIVRVVHD